MSEEPKSIWRKSWKGPSGAFLWFVALFIIVFFIVFFISMASRLESHVGKSIVVGLIFAGVFTAFGIFIRWVWCWKNFRRFLFGLACFITLIALAYAEEDWRGWHAWQKYKHELEAKGEK